MVGHDVHAYTIYAFTLEAVLNDVMIPFSQQIWVQTKFSLNSFKNVLFDQNTNSGTLQPYNEGKKEETV